MSREAASRVFLISSQDESAAREAAVRILFDKAGLGDLSGKVVALKANFNSADPFPASTHPDTVAALVGALKDAGAQDVTLAERSGMGETREVLDRLGIFDLAARSDFKVVVLDEEPKDSWVKIDRGGTHWLRGFYISRLFLESDLVIQTCCLKTHRFGGHFTMSLKNSVGLVAKRLPGTIYEYMMELHGSPYQRLMIAEINTFYNVDYAIIDAASAFVSGGPDKGERVEPGLMLASRDRVALDAAGVALLQAFGSSNLAKKPVFEQDQIRRAAELGVGAASASAIELVPLDAHAEQAAPKIRRVLDQS
jgi:uncharacterized protein (DUF362 family)